MNLQETRFHHEARLGEYLLQGENVSKTFRAHTTGQLVGLLSRASTDALNGSMVINHSAFAQGDINDFWNNYQQHVAGLTPERHGTQLQKAALFQVYETIFKPAIELQVDEGSGIDGNYGGGFSNVQKLEIDGKFYAIRKPKGDNLQEIDKHLEAAVRVAGIPHMEQIIAASYIDGRTVAPFIEGAPIGQCNLDQVTTIQVAELYDSMKQAETKGVGFDFAGKNLLYDPQEGFTVIDLGLSERFDDLSVAGALLTLIDVMAYEGDVDTESVQALIDFIDKVVLTIRKDATDDKSIESILPFIEDIRQNLCNS